ncbi:hypothetical protein BaRGS_00022809 [Batillaria attramentaria]|uniref:Uncharacterized protein n=1 Tax=Batillaria attramentaria TaxID=370345 RepID=A0ABD0KFX9_9CAEN
MSSEQENPTGTAPVSEAMQPPSQPQVAQTADTSPAPNVPGARGWWGRHRWQHYRSKAESPDMNQPDQSKEVLADSQNLAGENPASPAGWRHGGPHSWHPDWRAKVGEATSPLEADGKPSDMPGFGPHGDVRYLPPWRHGHYGGFHPGCYGYRMYRRSHEDSYIFREFDFM